MSETVVKNDVKKLPYKVKDISLAAWGRKEIELAEAEIRQGKMTYLSQSLQGVADKAETAFRKISISDTATVFEFVKAFKTLEEFVEKFGGQFDA